MAACGAAVLQAGRRDRPVGASVDSRQVAPGDLFFGLRGERVDGGAFARSALERHAWGVVVEPGRAREVADAGAEGWILAARDPLGALARLATEWRRELDCPTVGITGSTGKTSVKDICRAIFPLRIHASPENFNTEVGLPLAILAAPPETWELAESYSAAFLCAGRTKLADCEAHPAETELINVTRTTELARELGERGAFLVFLSTNLIFNGNKAFPTVEDTPKPTTAYGYQKAEAEKVRPLEPIATKPETKPEKPPVSSSEKPGPETPPAVAEKQSEAPTTASPARV